ncbi:MAG: quinoprotein relay system zinc metallohydrolase 2, partial [Aestuariivirgaceae bacterium]
GETVPPLPVIKIAKGMFVARGAVATANSANQGHIANLGFVVGGKYVAVIDSGGSQRIGLRLRAAVRATTSLPIKYVINTHMHPDHVLGNAAFLPDEPEFVGHHKLKSALSARAATYLDANRALVGADGFDGTRIVTPTISVADIKDLDLGDRTVRLMPFATAHTDNDLIVLDLKTQTAWLGDLLFTDHLPVIDGSLNGWLQVQQKLSSEHFNMVVPGHGDVSTDWPGVARPQVDYLTGLQRDIRKLIADGHTLGEALKDIPPPGDERWKLSGDFHRRNISAAFAELEWE